MKNTSYLEQMKNNSYLEEWLSETRYFHIMDVFDDNFAINFDKVTRDELAEKGLCETPSAKLVKNLCYAVSREENMKATVEEDNTIWQNGLPF